MVECWLPYGKTEVYVSVPLRSLLGTVEPHEGEPAASPRENITEALQNPLGSTGLGDLAKPGIRYGIALDGTMTQKLLTTAASTTVEYLHRLGAPSSNISLILGQGMRRTGDPELVERFGSSDHLKDISVVEHTGSSVSLTAVGKTGGGTELELCNVFTEADVRIAIGEVRPDPFTGVRGAQDAVLPGISSTAAITHSRGLEFTGDISPVGHEGNPVQEDAMEAAEMADVSLSLNLVTNGNGELLSSYAGAPRASWERAVESLGSSHRVKGDANADIIVVGAGGSRFDSDLYNAVQALRGASQVAKRNATIILLAECSEGLGAPGLEDLAQIDTLTELRRRYMLGAKEVYLLKTLQKRNEIVLVSALPSFLGEPLGITTMRTAYDAYSEVAEGRRGKRTLVVTNGRTTYPYVG
ncbi:MAG TPA: lactate racemase domain-containing protein [Patescibacteria group bacterium]|nr:lactate racemase domain-containing protein [Patescibacteria group bacterium]